MRGGWVERGTVIIRLTRPHFAFYRGYLEGLEPVRLAQRYPESAVDVDLTSGDPRTARCAVQWIRAQLLVAARRASNRSAARLITIAAEQLQHAPPGLPTLDAYREERDPDEVFSKEELIACFQDDHGAAIAQAHRTLQRNARLRARQMQALRQLETLVVADPRPADRVDGGLDPALAQRLRKAGIVTVAELVATINTLGFRWYRKVPPVADRAALPAWQSIPLGGTSGARCRSHRHSSRLDHCGVEGNQDLSGKHAARCAQPSVTLHAAAGLQHWRTIVGTGGNATAASAIVSA